MKLTRITLVTMLACILHCGPYALNASAYTANDGAKTILTDGTQADTSNAVVYVDGKNQDGWVLTVGSAGQSYSWGSLSFDIGHTWMVQGASTNNRPTITLTGTITVTGASTSGKIVTFKDFILTGNGSTALLDVSGTSTNGPNYRIANCRFNNSSGSSEKRSIFVRAYGVIDHNAFHGNQENRIWIQPSVNGWSNGLVMQWGTSNNVVIENNIFGNDTPAGAVVLSQAVDGDRGMEAIIRYNTFTNCNLESHGRSSGIGNEGLKAEVYKNQFYSKGNGSDNAAWLVYAVRGGTAAIYSNTVTIQGTDDGNLAHRIWVEQTETYPAQFQPGQGKTGVATRGSVPIYTWQNSVGSPNFGVCGVTSDPGTAVAGVDFICEGGAMPGYTAWTYPDPLVGAIAASSGSTPGSGENVQAAEVRTDTIILIH